MYYAFVKITLLSKKCLFFTLMMSKIKMSTCVCAKCNIVTLNTSSLVLNPIVNKKMYYY